MKAQILQDNDHHDGELVPANVRTIARNLADVAGIETLFFDFLGRVQDEIPSEGGYMACGNANTYAIYRFLGKEVK